MGECDHHLNSTSFSVDRNGGFLELAGAARSGCNQSLGQLVERCRNYLLLVANRGIGADLRVKVGASDLVQETLLAAQRGFGRFEGTSDEELRLWLRRILLNRMASARRTYFQTAKRQASREQSLSSESDSDAFQPSLVDAEITPQRRVLADEQTSIIERELARLPAHYREIVELRCFERRSFADTGQVLGISTDAARKRWCRAIECLRHQLDASDESK
jgi:RNA polymerase sigma-70 factor (ECF subfamily)